MRFYSDLRVREFFRSSTGILQLDESGTFLTLTFHSKFHQKSFSLFRPFQKFLFFLFHRKTDNRDRELWRKNLSFFLLNNPFCFFCPRRVLSWPFVFKQLLKLNWMFYVLSPTFQQHNTKFSFMPAFPAYALAHTRRTRKNETNTQNVKNFSQFLHAQHQHTSERASDDSEAKGREENFSPLLSNMWVPDSCLCLLHKRKCAPAEIFNASDYQKQIFSRAFYSSPIVV
jgi:hypothetical protein